MNATLIPDHELKDVLLTMAKAGLPAPKVGTILEEALRRFTTTPGDGIAAEIESDSKPLHAYRVRLSVTSEDDVEVEVLAEDIEQARVLAQEAAEHLDLRSSPCQYLMTSCGIKEVIITNADRKTTVPCAYFIAPLPPGDSCFDNSMEEE
ncbi:MAG: hypothetical protein JNK25_03535 [Phycisphaerae bacterium]|nr:hypothetical protein [Phycisphaerae bacterium]